MNAIQTNAEERREVVRATALMKAGGRAGHVLLDAADVIEVPTASARSGRTPRGQRHHRLADTAPQGAHGPA
ncbi:MULTISPECIES: hypothetical protein [Streptomyces]|uniref:Uncharacterized protein n=1 Tax=Streptomyces plumbiresistens TaxID=511811 RepID=A0ABP7RJ56_9ACTN